METKHTPTPWRIGPNGTIVANREEGGGLPLSIMQVFHLIHFGDRRDRDMSNANMHLIIECVNDHDALQARVAMLEAALHAIADGNQILGHWALADIVIRYQEIARAALRGTK